MIRALFAEASGCALLAFAALGAAQAAESAGLPIIPAVAAAAGLMLLVTITIMAPVSGGHLNPAITLLMLARREVTAPRALAYVVAQSLGAVAGGLLVSTMAAQAVTGAPLASAIAPGWGLSEAFATGGFVLVVAGALATQPQLAPLLAGGFGAAMVLCTVSGGMANPAVMAARAVTQGPGGFPPGLVLTLVAWQLAGAVVALIPSLWLFPARDG
ncbi:MAG: aquaporin [Pararhodobacter sp.]|nr:aquaporin [Pararhodobacter sp.]